MVSSYRLGDLVMLNILNEIERKELLVDYPNSIGAQYIYTNNTNNTNIDKITNIVLEYIDKISHLLPKDIENSTVIHIRLGDVVYGNEWHEKMKRPFDINYIKSIIPSNDKIYIIGKCFFAKTSSTNYDECIIESNKYLENMLNVLSGEHFIGENADIDLCCAIKSKCFVQGKGFFSKLILEIRKKLNLKNIETKIHDD